MTVIIIIGIMYFITHGFASIILDLIEDRNERKGTKELHKMWENKTGVYSYLNKTGKTRA